MKTIVVNELSSIASVQWNALNGCKTPFLRHEFLSALEKHHCVGRAHGWIPQHVLAYTDDGQLVGAVPIYLKFNSYGELVFDWSWADAYHRLGRHYYPKLVSAIPYTPVTGPRLLIAPHVDQDLVTQSLLGGVRKLCLSQNVSSFHWLFPNETQRDQLIADGYMPRMACQFHWRNQNYSSFDDFLAALSSRKRKNIRQERKKVFDENFDIEIVHGNEASEEQLERAHYFYTKTFDEKGGLATLSLPFFQEIAQSMGEQLVLIMAKKHAAYVATAICFRDDTHLYGRHWGSEEQYNNLHFELCFYQGISYAIENGLSVFEPGAQGEHKISRGFLPTATWSAHWIRDADFAHIIQDFLHRETEYMREYMAELNTHSPYRQTEIATSSNQ